MAQIMTNQAKLEQAKVLGLPGLNKRIANGDAPTVILRAAYAHAGQFAGDRIRQAAYGQYIPVNPGNIKKHWRRAII